jgi:cell fate regulator YaaT (PSP1 superfamily)
MYLAQVQFSPWDKKYSFAIPEEGNYKIGDKVIVDTEFSLELGEIMTFTEMSEPEGLKAIVRKATKDDRDKMWKSQEKKEAIKYCQGLARNSKLSIKVVDVFSSFSGSKLNFAFAADGRIDFRQLVKDLTIHFNKSIRLTQIGARDEARINGDCGHCGKTLCCKGHIKEFSSVSSDMAEAQQVAHRGSDRISGACGRLLCCLAYEYKGYVEMAEKLPAIGNQINVAGKKGVVLNQHVLKQTVVVKLPGERGDDYTILEVNPFEKNNNTSIHKRRGGRR